MLIKVGLRTTDSVIWNTDSLIITFFENMLCFVPDQTDKLKSLIRMLIDVECEFTPTANNREYSWPFVKLTYLPTENIHSNKNFKRFILSIFHQYERIHNSALNLVEKHTE